MTIAARHLPSPPDFEKPLPVGLRMTEEEFVAWYTFEGKAEWVDGEVVLMSPVSREHDGLQWWLRDLLGHYVEEKHLGEVLGPQFVTRLKIGRRRISRREPDVLFVAAERARLIGRNHLEGAPDLAIEIISPESQSRDRRQQYLEYEAAGVREYWIVDPLSREIEAYARRAEKFKLIQPAKGKLASTVVKGWYLRPEWLWSEPRKRVLAALAELGVK